MQFAELQKQMIAAMKAKDKVRKEAISSLVSAAKKVAIDEGCRDDISEEIVGRVILKEMKTVKEQIDSCPADRTDLTGRNVDPIQISFQDPDDSLLCKEITRIRSFCQIL